MADDSESWTGKWADATRRWGRTYWLLLTNRRALLSTAAPTDDPPMPPVAFMLSAAAGAFVIDSALDWKAPDSELPPAAATLFQAAAVAGNPRVLIAVMIAVLNVGVFWLVFRLIRPRFSTAVLMRHSAYNVGGQMPGIALEALPLFIWRVTGTPVAPWVEQVTDFALLGLYLWLLGIALRQLADESGRRVRRLLFPFTLSFVPTLAASTIFWDMAPGEWIGRVKNMEPAIHAGDAIHINHWILRSRPPEPGEVVQLHSDDADAPSLIRVLAEPGDRVVQRGADFVVNDSALPREPARLRHDGTDTGLAAAFRQRLGEHSFTAQYGPLLAPKPCLPRPTVLADDTYLLAYDTRADGVLACGLFRRSQMTGLADWNARTSARP
jgi:signal peptidase S26 family